MTTFLEPLAEALLGVLSPLEEALDDEHGIERLLEHHGWRASVDAGRVAAVAGALGLGLLQAAQEVAQQLADGTGDAAEVAKELSDATIGLYDRLRSLDAGSSGLPTTLVPFNDPAFWPEFTRDLLASMVAGYLEREQPLLFGALLLFGLIELKPGTTPPGANRTTYEQVVIHWDQLGAALANPGRQLATTYQWNGPPGTFAHARLLQALERLLLALGVPARRGPVRQRLGSFYPGGQPPATLKELAVPLLSGGPSDASGYVELGLLLAPVPPAADRTRALDGVVVSTLAQGYQTVGIALGGSLRLELRGGFDADGALSVEVHPGATSVTTAQPALDAEVKVTGRPERPWRLLGSPDGHRIEAGGLLAAARLSGTLSDPELTVRLGTGEGPNLPPVALVLQFAEGDGFLRRLFGSEPQRLEFSALATWSSKTGLSLQASAGLRLVVPINRTIGIVQLHTLTVTLLSAGNGAELVVAIAGNAELGPLRVSAEGLGVRLALAPTPKSPGRSPGVFGDLDVQFGLKSPDGFGMTLGDGPFTGGGYLAYDPVHGHYAGVLELRFQSLSLKAVGLLTTRMPDGSSGFSLVVIITAEFDAVQLGFGFTLNGVGGLIGINRSFDQDRLLAGLSRHTLDSVLFPKDPVGNAPQLLADVGAVFPPAPGRFVFGPMAKIGWGTPTILTLELGLLLELPAPVRLVILGKLRMALPDDKTRTVLVQVDVIGIIDFHKGQASVDAALYASQIAGFPLTGAMALRANWLDRPGFVLAVGGLNPRFQPPSGFPQLERLALSLTKGDNPRLRLEAYLALTSNTVQFGARVELYVAAVFGITLEGMLGFDALCELSPFRVVVDVAGSLCLKCDGRTLFNVNVELALSGPNPWQARGRANFELFGSKCSIAFDTSIGDPAPAALPPPAAVATLLEGALKDPANWTSALPAGERSPVTLRTQATPQGKLLVHPLGRLEVRQRVVPLDVSITRFGSAVPDETGPLAITSLKLNGQTCTPLPPVEDYFAPAQFLTLSDTEKLERPSFERLHSGVSYAGDLLTHNDSPPPAPVTYRTTVLGAPEVPARELGEELLMSAETLALAAQTGPAGLAATRQQGTNRYQGPPIGLVVQDTRYVIATVSTLAPQPGVYPSWAAAADGLRHWLAGHPDDAGRLQVVPSHEVGV